MGRCWPCRLGMKVGQYTQCMNTCKLVFIFGVFLYPHKYARFRVPHCNLPPCLPPCFCGVGFSISSILFSPSCHLQPNFRRAQILLGSSFFWPPQGGGDGCVTRSVPCVIFFSQLRQGMFAIQKKGGLGYQEVLLRFSVRLFGHCSVGTSRLFPSVYMHIDTRYARCASRVWSSVLTRVFDSSNLRRISKYLRISEGLSMHAPLSGQYFKYPTK